MLMYAKVYTDLNQIIFNKSYFSSPNPSAVEFPFIKIFSSLNKQKIQTMNMVSYFILIVYNF